MTIFQRIFCLLLPLMFAAGPAGFAQYRGGKNPGQVTPDRQYFKESSEKGTINLRWYPFGLLNTSDLNLTLGAEYGYHAHQTIALDLGYIMASVYGNSSGQLEPASGLIARVNHRWYLDKTRHSFFMEAEAATKLAKYKSENQWVGRGVVEGVPAYEELMPVSSKKEVLTLLGKFGQRNSFVPDGRLGFEWVVGLGIRYRNYYPDLPDDAQVLTNNGWGINPWNYGSGWLPDFQLNLRLTWKLK
jgi:hypothetical protein